MFFAKNHSVFVVAHPDDIELFMFKSLYKAIKERDKITILVLTTGDDQKGYQNNIPDAYWRLRVNGQIKALKFLTHRIHGIIKNEEHSESDLIRSNFNGISIINLMLPDDLTSTKNTHTTKLAELYSNKIDHIKTIHKVKNYTKPQLISKLSELIHEKNNFSKNTYLHITSLSNKDDHQDHGVASNLALEASKNIILKENTIFYQTYKNKDEAINFSTEEIILHSAVWGIYNSQIQSTYPDLSGRLQLPYLGKQYKLL